MKIAVCVALALLAAGWACVGQTSRPVLVSLAADYHCEALQRVVSGLVANGHSVVVAAGGDVVAAEDCLEGIAGQVSVIDHPQAPPSDYNGVVFIGFGWYEDEFLTRHLGLPQPAYTEVATTLVADAFDRGAALGGLGAGVYPLIYSGLLPPGTQIASYDCPDLYETALAYGLDPIVATGSPPSGTFQYGPDAGLVTSPAASSWVVTTSVPDTWYRTDEGTSLVAHYGEAIDAFVDRFSAAVPVASLSASPWSWWLPSSGPMPEAPLIVYNPNDVTVGVCAGYCATPQATSTGCADPGREDAASTEIPPLGIAAIGPGVSGYTGGVTVDSSAPIIAIARENVPPLMASWSEDGYYCNGLPTGEASFTWYLPCLRQTPSDAKRISLVNPGSEPVVVDIHYVGPSHEEPVVTATVDPYSTTTIDPRAAVGAEWRGAAVIRSAHGVIAAVANISSWDGASCRCVGAGVPFTSSTWYLPTLSSGTSATGNDECTIGLLNPGDAPATVSIRVGSVEAGTATVTKTVDAGAVLHLDGNDLLASPWVNPVTILSDLPIAASAEARFSSSDGETALAAWPAGASAGAKEWVVAVADATTEASGGRVSHLGLANISAGTADVSLAVILPDGSECVMQRSVAPGGRADVTQAETPGNTWGAAVIVSSDEPIVVEVVTSWFDAAGKRTWSLGSLGASATSTKWVVPGWGEALSAP